jgi:hypothetical protein
VKDGCTVSLTFAAAADVDPNHVAALVGADPSEVRGGLHPAYVWKLSLRDSSPVNAPRVASDLARELLARRGIAAEKEAIRLSRLAQDMEVRFRFDFDRLLNFSYEFDASVVKNLSQLGARVSSHHYDFLGEQSPTERFGSGASPHEGCEASLRISGNDLDPDLVTDRLGIASSASGRQGKVWLLEGSSCPQAIQTKPSQPS